MSSVQCTNCYKRLKDYHTGLCPKCGAVVRSVNVGVAKEIDTANAVSWKSVREYYEKNRGVHYVLIAISITSPLIGLVLAGAAGVVVGFVLSGIAYFLSPRAIVKVREVRHGG